MSKVIKGVHFENMQFPAHELFLKAGKKGQVIDCQTGYVCLHGDRNQHQLSALLMLIGGCTLNQVEMLKQSQLWVFINLTGSVATGFNLGLHLFKQISLEPFFCL